MEKQEIGHIEVVFTEISKQEVVVWSNTIKKEDLYITTINNKIEGGNLTDKLHLTLFYGFDEKLVDKNKMSEYINGMKLDKIKIDGLGTFPVASYDCNVLFLKVNDENDLLKGIHDDLAKFPNFSEYQKFQYIPHITIAYTRKDFDITEVSHNQPKVLIVEKIIYHSKTIEKS